MIALAFAPLEKLSNPVQRNCQISEWPEPTGIWWAPQHCRLGARKLWQVTQLSRVGQPGSENWSTAHPSGLRELSMADAKIGPHDLAIWRDRQPWDRLVAGP